MKSTDELINQLASKHTKIKRDFSPEIRTFFTIYTISLVVSIGLFLINPYAFKIQNLFHALELLSLFLFIHALVYLGFKSFVPGENKKLSLMLFGLATFLMIIVFLNRSSHPQIFNQVRHLCEVEAIGISILTTFIGHLMMKKNEYAKKSASSSVLFIALPIVATFIMHGICSITFMHVLICHFLCPLLVPIIYLICFKDRSK